MPYYISDKQSDCAGWATIKVADGKTETITCHGDNKQAAVDHMVALSMAEGMKPLGEYFPNSRSTMNSRILICDIDDTLIHNGRLIEDTQKWVNSQDVGIVLVTGRLITQKAQTVAQLAKLGIDYDELMMNDLGSPAASNEFKKLSAEKLLQAYDVQVAIDNDAGAREAYASLGIPVVDPAHLPPIDLTHLKAQRDMPDIESPQVEMAEPTKQDLVYLLKDLLGDVVTFRFIAHGFHWNVRGINFSQYHEFFGDIYQDAEASIDPIAENIRKLNFDAPFLLTDFMESSPELEVTNSSDPQEMCRTLYQANEDVRECIVKALAMADELEEQGIVNFLAERQDQHSKWQWQLRAIVGDSFAKSYEIDVEEVAEGMETGQGNETNPPIGQEDKGNPQSAQIMPNGTPIVETNSNERWIRAANAIKARLEPTQQVPLEERSKQIETRVNHASVELRAVEGGDGMTFRGYAAVFNSASEPLPFTEVIAPGAFIRSLKARNDIKLLWNHDTGQVLGSTRAGTLTLTEDNHGLLATAVLPDTQLGRDAATLIKRGDVANMSFGFTVPKGGDSWSADGQQRTLNSVKLHEVSIVSYPAYQSTSVSVRSTDTLDTDTLAGALASLEAGEALEPSQADILRDIVDKLTMQATVPDGTILDLKKKQLDLLLKRI